MGRPAITEGTWTTFSTVEQPSERAHYYACRVHKIDWKGPGRYVVLRYSQKCPRGCCYDGVYEIVPAAAVVEEVREEMRRLASLLKEARA